MIEVLDWMFKHQAFMVGVVVAICCIGYWWTPLYITQKHSHVHHYDIECAGKATIDCSGQGEQEARVVGLVKKNSV